MNCFSERFTLLTKSRIIPLNGISIDLSKYQFNSIRENLKKGNFNKIEVCEELLSITFNKDELLSILTYESIGTYAKLLDHKINILEQRNKILKESWKLVTDYYIYFFAANFISKIFWNFSIDLKKDELIKINSLILEMNLKDKIINPGQFNIQVHFDEFSDNNLVLKISPHKYKTHEANWHFLKNNIDSFKNYSDKENDELIYISSILNIFNIESSNFLSTVRNDINYKIKHGIDNLNTTFPYYDLWSKTEKELVPRAMSHTRKNNFNDRIFVFFTLGSLIDRLAKKIIIDLMPRLNIKNRNIKKIFENSLEDKITAAN